ncbi:uncharacterized protein LOC144086199 [Stigmatopora argus]
MTFQRLSWRMDRGFGLAVAFLTVLAVFPTVRGTDHLSFDNSTEANVTRAGCDEEVLCLETPEDCNPEDNQNCFFVSLDADSSMDSFNLTVRLSGNFSENSTGIAFGLTQNFSEANTTLYVCGRRSNGNFFFGTVTRLPDNNLVPNERTTNQIRNRLNENNTQCEFILPNVNTSNKNEMIDGTTAIVILGRVDLTTENNTVENFTKIMEFMRVNLTEANGTVTIPLNVTLPLNVTREGCNETVLCLETPEDCNPVNNQACLFASLNANSPMAGFNLTVRLSGNFSDNSTGIALGLTQNFMAENTVLYVCGRNSTGGFFFRIVTRFPNNTVVSNDMDTGMARYVLTENISQCEFTIQNVDTRNKGETRDGNTAIVVLGTVVVNNMNTVESFTDELMGGRVNLTNVAGTIYPKNITNADCGNTKLCIASPNNCNPQMDSCLFSSLQTMAANEILNITVELDGDSTGSSYIALGLTQSGMTESTNIYLCGRNGSAFVFQRLVRNNSDNSLRQSDQEVMDVCSFVNDSSIQCTFTIVNLNTSRMTRESSPMFSVAVGGGAIEGGVIGAFNPSFTSVPLDITNPMANVAMPVFNEAELNITRDGCNITNLCVDQPDNCDPSQQNMCQFMSSNTSNIVSGAFNMSVRLSGYTRGFFALALAPNASTGTSTVYLCGNSNNGSRIFQTYRRNNANDTFVIIPQVSLISVFICPLSNLT